MNPIKASELRDRVDVPVPATAVIETSKQLAETGLFEARLISARPLNPANGPQDEFERTGLGELEKGAKEYERLERVDGKLYYRAMVPDVAVSEGCLNCHPGYQKGNVLGGLSISIPYDDKARALAASSWTMGGVAAGLVAAIIALTWFLMRRVVTRPLLGVSAQLEALAAGGADLTVRIPVGARDEIGRIADAFNRFMETLHDLMSRVRDTSGELARASREMAAAGQEVNAAAEEVNAAAEQISGSARSLSNMSERLAQLVARFKL